MMNSRVLNSEKEDKDNETTKEILRDMEDTEVKHQQILNWSSKRR